MAITARQAARPSNLRWERRESGTMLMFTMSADWLRPTTSRLGGPRCATLHPTSKNPDYVETALPRAPDPSPYARTKDGPPMQPDLPESESQTPDGVPLGWVAPWEKPQMMVVEEREGMCCVHVPGVRLGSGRHHTTICADPTPGCESSSLQHGRIIEREVKRGV